LPTTHHGDNNTNEPGAPSGVPELLAPAGQWDSLRAAVANGADAVYFGLDDFNARRRAANFRLDELTEVVGFVHDRNVRAYVAMNTLVFTDELDRSADYVRAVAAAGADAIIVQDLGLARLIHRLAPTLAIHASTQMTLTEPEGIELARSLGVSRVILARELSIDEIAAVAAAARPGGVDVEVFVHGALCISYSGQCLASLALGRRSGNRGQCAQPCRLPYDLLVDGRPHPTPAGEYLLSPHDLCALDLVPRLAAAGVAALKIEGRLKDANYVAAVTQAYRAALDAGVGDRVCSVPVRASLQEHLSVPLRTERLTASLRTRPPVGELLAGSFSRGFVTGYLEGADHRRFVAGDSPARRGRQIGVVTAVGRDAVHVRLKDPAAEPLKAGDGVAFGGGAGEAPEGGRVYQVRPVGRGSVELSFGRGDVDFSRIAVGDAVWLTDDPQARRRLAGTFARVEPWRRVGLSFDLCAVPGQPISLVVRDEQGRTVTLQGSVALAPSVLHPLTVELLREQFGRLGQTPFALAEVALSGPAGPAEAVDVLAPKSELNDLRRRAVAALLAQRAAAGVHAIADEDALAHLRAEVAAGPGSCPRAGGMGVSPRAPACRLAGPAGVSPAESRPGRPRDARAGGPRHDLEQSLGPGSGTGPHAPLLCVLVRDVAQLRALLDWHRSAPADGRCDLVYADLPEPAEWAEALAAGREAGVPVGWVTPRILKPGEMAAVGRVAELAASSAAAPAAVLVRNLGSLARLRRLAPHVPLIGDFSLNAANELSAGWLCQAGLARLAPGWDVDFARLRQLAERLPPWRLEAIVYSHVPMFHTQYCLWAAHLGDGPSDQAPAGDRPDEAVGRCGRACRRRGLALRDRKGMPARSEPGCRTTIFRGRADNHVGRLAELADLGLGAVRLEMLDEPPAQVVEIAGRCAELIAGRGGR
jgi:putative protease